MAWHAEYWLKVFLVKSAEMLQVIDRSFTLQKKGEFVTLPFSVIYLFMRRMCYLNSVT